MRRADARGGEREAAEKAGEKGSIRFDTAVTIGYSLHKSAANRSPRPGTDPFLDLVLLPSSF